MNDIKNTNIIEDTTWMKNISDDTYINHINIPGSHDSCCKNVGFLFFKNIAQTQVCNIKDQLEAGVRLFDFRLQFYTGVKGSLTLCHDLLKCKNEHNDYISFEYEVMTVIEEFLSKYPSETIIIAPGFEYGNKEDYSRAMMEWWNRAKEKEGNNGLLYYSSINIPKLGEVRGKIVIIGRNCFTYGIDDWRSICSNIGITVRCLDRQCTNDVDYIIENHYDYKEKEKIDKIYEYLNNSPYYNQIINNNKQLRICFTSSNYVRHGPEYIANEVNKKIKYYTFEKGKYYGWWFIDFIQKVQNCELFYHFPSYYIYLTNTFKNHDNNTYISDIYLAVTNRKFIGNKDRESAMSILMKERMYIDGEDISAGQGKKFMILGRTITGIKEQGITHITATISREFINICDWNWAPLNSNIDHDMQNLNLGYDTTTHIYLHYTKDPIAGKPIKEIKIWRDKQTRSYQYFLDLGWEAACWYLSDDIANLKEDTRADCIYCLFKRNT